VRARPHRPAHRRQRPQENSRTHAGRLGRKARPTLLGATVPKQAVWHLWLGQCAWASALGPVRLGQCAWASALGPVRLGQRFGSASAIKPDELGRAAGNLAVATAARADGTRSARRQ
jgi:hypothetical protein